ncbi:hypothetical protein LZQ00_16440 [Sphingobacterium sp. SRCM116780]|uniref:hypothetical protein n=1 Tax=Sphingobacterium sp. SRCM116780 TaxID=2907623 RepID=UPI001F2F5C6A|nr:hypothetical protein [Sphingobacterium sp. SRCM116780]UIR55836.1 hypothetical protein LZQ00_16440 [Sphingobacterium sp. SRCM116780]
MSPKVKRLLFISVNIILLFSCQKKEHAVGFYYWKTIYKTDTLSQEVVQKLKSNTLFLRIMDIDFKDGGVEPIPISPISFEQKVDKNQQLVPVVFINQKIFTELDSLQIRGLAHKIVPFVTEKIKQGGHDLFQELQIDCDWTKTSRDKFFYLLAFLQTMPELSQVVLTSTVRLHQIKNIKTSGIPPVKRATLMCYNMGNLRQFGDHNSILNQKDLDTYLSGSLKNYPLALDIALPLFDWYVAFRDHEYIGISKYIDRSDLDDKSIFTQNPKTQLFLLNQNLEKANLKKGDVIRHEFVTKEQLILTAKFLNKELQGKENRIIFYHLAPEIVSQYTYADLQEIIAAF